MSASFDACSIDSRTYVLLSLLTTNTESLSASKRATSPFSGTLTEIISDSPRFMKSFTEGFMKNFIEVILPFSSTVFQSL